MVKDFVIIGRIKWSSRSKCPFCDGDLEESGGNGIAVEYFNCQNCGFSINVKSYLRIWDLINYKNEVVI